MRTRLCFEISRRLMAQPMRRTIDRREYGTWRHQSLSQSWKAFSDLHVDNKIVLDFGCGDGQMAFFIATQKKPKAVVGVDIDEEAIQRCISVAKRTELPKDIEVRFVKGDVVGLPFPEKMFDTLLAFDCLEHVLSPNSILKEWFRVLKPGGRCLIEWFPFKGPWGPHMESLIPIPWAHVIFSERTLFRTAEKIYELPNFVPRTWDLDANGQKKPNKWRAWSSFKEQGYINELDLKTFKKLATGNGFTIERFDRHSFSGSAIRSKMGAVLMSLPLIGEYCVSYVHIELVRL